MFRLILFATIISLGIASDEELLENRGEGRIFSGNTAQLRQFQYIVSIRRVNTLNHVGGGTLITTSWVLTARTVTSFFVRPADLSVALGILNFANPVVSPGMVATAQEIRTNEELALIRIPTIACNAARFGVISPIFLESRILGNIIESLTAGWGPIDNQEPNTILRFKSVTTLAECANTTALCTTGTLCSTDIGAPLVSLTGLIGVAVSTSCGISGLNDIYARISSNNHWITSVLT